MKNTTSITARIVTLSGLFVGALALSAFATTTWTAPTTTPPGGNVDQPINVGSSSQIKLGSLDIVASGLAKGLIVENGAVGIGTTSPSAKLHVVGSATAGSIGLQVDTAPIKAAGGLIIETRTADPVSPATGAIWLVTP